MTKMSAVDYMYILVIIIFNLCTHLPCINKFFEKFAFKNRHCVSALRNITLLGHY